MAAGDTFRAAASEQLEVWAERTGSDIVVAEKDKGRPVPGIINSVHYTNSLTFQWSLFFCIKPQLTPSYENSPAGGSSKRCRRRLRSCAL